MPRHPDRRERHPDRWERHPDRWERHPDRREWHPDRWERHSDLWERHSDLWERHPDAAFYQGENMARIVCIHGDAAVYPAGACVSCLRPASSQVEIVKVKGQTVRKVRVPFCAECLALRQHKSVRQVLFERVATVNSLLLALVVGLYAWRVLSATPTLRGTSPTLRGTSAVDGATWLLGALSALIVFGVMYLLVEPWSRSFRSAAAVAAQQAVTINDFDWETIVLAFRNEEYAELFARANHAQSQPDAEKARPPIKE